MLCAQLQAMVLQVSLIALQGLCIHCKLSRCGTSCLVRAEVMLGVHHGHGSRLIC